MNKSHLSEAQRKVIESMLKAKTSQSHIAPCFDRYCKLKEVKNRLII